MGLVLGIDLGTTNSAMAVYNIESGEDAQIVKNIEGEDTTPSVVLFQSVDGKDEPLVGSLAKRQAVAFPEDTVQYVKRYMGDPNWRFDSSSGNTYKSEEVSAIILKKLKSDAENVLGEDVSGVVITVPAYFDDARRVATKQAGKIAGFNVLRVLNEPTAAALSFGMDTMESGNVLVYDLGGGTFDVTILKVDGYNFKVLATDGDRNLGGFDIDNAIMKYVMDNVDGNVMQDSESLASLREKCEFAKIALSNVVNTFIHVNTDSGMKKIQLSREKLVDLCTVIFSRTRDITEDTLGEAGLSWSDIDHVLLVGGSTKMPAIKDMVEKMSGKKASINVNPDLSVAKGAAIQALIEIANNGYDDGSTSNNKNNLPDINIQDVTSQSLGVLVIDTYSGKKINQIVIPHNSEIPNRFEADLCTVADNQTAINVEVTQGDDPDPDYVTIIGSSTLEIPAYPKGAPIRIIYHYDIDQTVQVEVVDLTAKKMLGTFEIDRIANLNINEVMLAKAKLDSLNF